VEEQVALVREALIEEYEIKKRELEGARRQAESLGQELQVRDLAIGELHAKIDKYQKEARLSQERTEQDHEARERLREEVTRLADALRETDRVREESQSRRAFVLKWIVLPLCMIGALTIAINCLAPQLSQQWHWVYVLMPIALSLAIWTWVTDARGQRTPHVHDWRFFERFHRLRRWLLLVVPGLLLAGVAGNFLYDLIKDYLRHLVFGP
jgi:multisubunit Na+/H+ antiporter MnhB subunit